MNRRTLIGIIGCLLVVGLLLWLFDGGEEKNSKPVTSTKWDLLYGLNSIDPQGLAFFDKLLRTHCRDSVYVVTEWEQLDSIPNKDSATYIFIGEQFRLTTSEIEELLYYTDSSDAHLVLAFDETSENVYGKFWEDNAYYWEFNNRFYVAMGDTSLPFYAQFQNDTIYDNWFTFDPEAFIDSNYIPFAYAMNYPIAYTQPRAGGAVIMHSVPRLFMNYQVLQPNGFYHAETVLRHIPKDRPVIWLEYGRKVEQEPQLDRGNADVEDDSYIQFLMKEPGLRTAFLLAIAIFILYALFRAKRREPVLGGVPERRNMSLAFVETLSSIYLSRNSPYGIMLVLRKNFYTTIYRHFYIDLLTTKNREEDIKRLVEKASVDEIELRKALDMLETNKSQQINETNLGELYKYIRRFYAETGISRPRNEFVKSGGEITLHRSLLTGGVILLVGLTAFLRGVYMLTEGSGTGMILVAVALFVGAIGLRFMFVPVAKITGEEIRVYHPILGSKTLDLTKNFTYTTTASSTTVFGEDAKQISIQHAMLSRSGRHSLKQFIEHVKHQSS